MKKKHRKLAVQVGIALTVIMLLTNSLTAYITITGTKNMCLESKNEKLINEVQTYINHFMHYESAPTFRRKHGAYPVYLYQRRKTDNKSQRGCA